MHRTLFEMVSLGKFFQFLLCGIIQVLNKQLDEGIQQVCKVILDIAKEIKWNISIGWFSNFPRIIPMFLGIDCSGTPRFTQESMQ